MGFLDTILGMFGVGQPKVSLTINPNSIGRGGIITGTVKVEGGRRPIPVTAFEAKLKQKKVVKTEQGSRSDFTTLFEESAPQGGAIIEPGATMSWSFVLQVPADAPPSAGDITYAVEASLDCPGWDPSNQQPLGVTAEIEASAGEDLKSYHVLPERRHFRNSSVKGDFRVLPCAGGFVTTWKTEISVRNEDGSPRCRIPGWGKSMTVSPDGTRLLASNAHKGLAFFDLTTGEMVGEALSPGDWIFDTLWLADGTVVASSSDKLFIYNEAGELLRTIEDLDGSFYASGLAAAPTGFFVSDGNGSRILQVDAEGTVLSTIKIQSPSALFAGNGVLTVECHDSIALVDPASGAVKSVPLPGKGGVRYAGQEQHSSSHFKAMPHASPDGQSVLVQDGSGALWQLGAAKGAPMRVFTRDVADFVEDTAWVDDQHFLAVLNSGIVKKISLGGKVDFEQQDVD